MMEPSRPNGSTSIRSDALNRHIVAAATPLVYDRSPRTRSARVSCLSIEIEIEFEINIDMGGLP